MATKQRPTANIPKKTASTKKNRAPEQEEPAPNRPRPRGRFGPLAVALVGALSAALGVVGEAIHAHSQEPTRAPCSLVCPK
jgi:hypothetical protein